MNRRHDIDWLRVFATFVLFPFHVGKVFDVAPYYPLKNPELSDGMANLTGFIHQWHMPLFFLLAGWSAHAALARRNARTFGAERVRRLFVPFLFGTLVLCPLIVWVGLTAQPGFDEPFFTFLPTFYTRLDRFSWSHLWFLIYLFVFSLLWLPLLLALRGRSQARVSPVVIYLAIVPLAAAQILLRVRWPGYQNLVDDWGNFTYYSSFFLFGACLGRWPSLEEAVEREHRRAGLLGLAALLVLGPTSDVLAHPGLGFRWAVFWTCSTAAGVGCIAYMLGVAARWRSRSNAFLAWASEGSLAIYILHQLAIVLLAAIVIRLPWSIAAKFWLLLPASVVATLACYQLVVRPVPLLRRLCGMASKPTAGGETTGVLERA
jgi:peptidoglycan/LPS O-acetylase OafA/YrhL